MEPVRIGLVGYGFGGRWFHAPLLRAAVECHFLGVVTSSPERRALVDSDHPGLPTFDSLEALRAAGAEAVAISTPAATHSALTDQALELGLAVVSDKPFALDAAAARRSVELAERLGLPLAPYQNRRWDSDFLTVRALAAAGTLGELTRFESRFERLAPDPGPPASGGGTLRDFGSHLVDQALVLLGPVATVYAEWRLRDNGLDDDVFVALTHENSARSHLWGSWSQGAPGPAVPGDRDEGQLRQPDAHGRPGGAAARRAHAGDARCAVGRRAGGPLGARVPGGRRRGGADASPARGAPSIPRSRRPSAGSGPCPWSPGTPSPPRPCSTPRGGARPRAS